MRKHGQQWILGSRNRRFTCFRRSRFWGGNRHRRFWVLQIGRNRRFTRLRRSRLCGNFHRGFWVLHIGGLCSRARPQPREEQEQQPVPEGRPVTPESFPLGHALHRRAWSSFLLLPALSETASIVASSLPPVRSSAPSQAPHSRSNARISRSIHTATSGKSAW